MTYVWYFAYGSNLDPNQMKKRVGSFQEARKARLPGFKLVFRGYSKKWNGAVADIEPSEESIVYGVVYKITEQQLRKLDGFEGYPRVYQRRPVEVITEKGDVISAVTYIRVKKEPQGIPSREYLETIIKGLKAHGYPEELKDMVVKISKRNLK